MSTIIEFAENWDQVPDEYKTLEPGIYEATVANAEVKPTMSGGQKLEIVVAVHTPNGDRNCKGSILIGRDVNEGHKVKMKRFFKSISMEPPRGAFDLASVVGRKCKVKVIKDTFTGDDGQKKEFAKIADFLY